MSAYVIVEIEIVDPVGYEEYKKQAAATAVRHNQPRHAPSTRIMFVLAVR